MLIDLSSNNADPATIDWAQAAAAGVQAVFGKATQGTNYVNPYFAGYRACRAAGIAFAAYHFANMGTPAAEARYFHSVAGPDAKVLDIETSSTTAWIDAFLAALGEPATQEMTYGSASTLPNNIDRGLLWVAAYGPNPGRGSCWQYSDAVTVPGIPGQVDASIWTGTPAQFSAFFGITDPPPGGTVPVPTDTVDYFAMPGGDPDTDYWTLHADGGLFGYGAVTDGQLDYIAVANDGSRYHFGPTESPGIISYPGLPATARQGTRYFVKLVPLSYKGVSIPAAGPPGPQGPPGSAATVTAIETRLANAAKALAG